ncbi:hypothetical protein ACC728_14210 [Rhizobium ruizarguesonis]
MTNAAIAAAHPLDADIHSRKQISSALQNIVRAGSNPEITVKSIAIMIAPAIEAPHLSKNFTLSRPFSGRRRCMYTR